MNSERVCATAAITYRQLDHWTRLGYLRPMQENRKGNPGVGSGYDRDYPASEVAAARVMGQLLAAGLTPAAAARVARGEHDLAPGVHVTITDPSAAAA